MARAKRVSKRNTTTECYDVLDGMAKVLRVKQSGKCGSFVCTLLKSWHENNF